MSETEMQVPAHIAERIAARKEGNAPMSAIAEALAGFASPPRISIKGSRFRLVENSVEKVVGTELDVVIVGANPNTSKVFFAAEYDPDAGEVRPDCASADGKHPDANISDPVCSSCAQCPNNVLGSKITNQGNKSKLCSDVRYLAVVPAADPHKVYQLNVSVTAMKPLREYIQSLGNYGVVPEEVVTKLTFDDAASYPLLNFNKAAFLPQKALDAIEAVKATPEVATAVKTDIVPALPASTSEAAEEKAESNVKKIEDAKSTKAKAKPAAKKPAKKPAAKKKEEPVKEVSEDADLTDIESHLDDIFG
jgi:hypothetical protein